MWLAGPCSSSATCPTSKDLLPATKGTTLQRTPITGPRFVPKVSTKTKTRFTQSSVRVSPYTEDGTAYDATRWFINFSIHALISLSLFMGDPFFSGGIRTLKSLHWVSFQQVRTDVHARNPWFPPPGPSVPAGIFLHYLSCEKSNKILFFADSRGLHHLYSAAHHWGSGFHSSGGRGFFKVYIHHLAKLWSLILLQRKGSYHTKIQISTKQSFQFSFNIEVSFLGSPSSNWDLCWSSLGHPQRKKAGNCHSLSFHWAKPKPFCLFITITRKPLSPSPPSQVVDILHDWLDIDFSVAEECLTLAVWTPIRSFTFLFSLHWFPFLYILNN